MFKINLLKNLFKRLLDSNNELGFTIDYRVYKEEQKNILINSNKGNYYMRVYLLKFNFYYLRNVIKKNKLKKIK